MNFFIKAFANDTIVHLMLISFYLQVEWQANGVALSRAGRVDVTEDTDHSKLRIRDMTREDAGTYRIKISNKAGSDSASFDVSVKGERTFYFPDMKMWCHLNSDDIVIVIETCMDKSMISSKMSHLGIPSTFSTKFTL